MNTITIKFDCYWICGKLDIDKNIQNKRACTAYRMSRHLSIMKRNVIGLHTEIMYTLKQSIEQKTRTEMYKEIKNPNRIC
jgi:hypothetical protein